MIEEITSPPFLDDTAQEMVTKLQAIANNINNNAGQVSYSNTTSHLQAETVQTAIDEVKGITDNINASLTQLGNNKLDKTYVTFFAAPSSGTNLNTLVSGGISVYQIGNISQYTNAPSGKGSTGLLVIFRANTYITQLWLSNNAITQRASYDSGSTWGSWL